MDPEIHELINLQKEWIKRNYEKITHAKCDETELDKIMKCNIKKVKKYSGHMEKGRNLLKRILESIENTKEITEEIDETIETIKKIKYNNRKQMENIRKIDNNICVLIHKIYKIQNPEYAKMERNQMIKDFIIMTKNDFLDTIDRCQCRELKELNMRKIQKIESYDWEKIQNDCDLNALREINNELSIIIVNALEQELNYLLIEGPIWRRQELEQFRVKVIQNIEEYNLRQIQKNDEQKWTNIPRSIEKNLEFDKEINEAMELKQKNTEDMQALVLQNLEFDKEIRALVEAKQKSNELVQKRMKRKLRLKAEISEVERMIEEMESQNRKINEIRKR